MLRLILVMTITAALAAAAATPAAAQEPVSDSYACLVYEFLTGEECPEDGVPASYRAGVEGATLPCENVPECIYWLQDNPERCTGLPDCVNRAFDFAEAVVATVGQTVGGLPPEGCVLYPILTGEQCE